jgi:hypothetical protein
MKAASLIRLVDNECFEKERDAIVGRMIEPKEAGRYSVLFNDVGCHFAVRG